MDTLLGATLQKNLVERNAGAEAALRSCLAAHKDDVLWSQFRREVENCYKRQEAQGFIPTYDKTLFLF